MPTNTISNIAIVGATGQQGKYIVAALLAAGKHTITAITRFSSDARSNVPTGVKISTVDYDHPDTIVNALQGQDCLIITMNTRAPKDTSEKLIRAAAAANVPWVLPDEWGLDTANEEFGREVFIGPAKVAARKLIEELGVSSWTAVACGFWYEYSLGTMQDTYGFDLTNRSVTFYDDGEQKITSSTWEQVARAVTALLCLPITSENGPSLEGDFKNTFAYVKSFTVSQRDMFASCKRVTGTTDGDWKVDYQSAAERVVEGTKAFEEGNRLGFVKAMYARAFYKTGEGNFENSHALVNTLLGLPEEDLDTCTKGAFEIAKRQQK